jgi:DNA-directed RNA polymerase subunit omega
MSLNNAVDFVTIDKCLEKVENRFELAVIASVIAREIENGSRKIINSDRKSTVVALQEIAEGNFQVDVIKEKIIQGMQKNTQGILDTNTDPEYNLEATSEVDTDVSTYIENGDELSLSEEEMDLLDSEDINFKS